MLRNGNIIYGWGLNPDNLVEMYKVVLDLNVAHGPSLQSLRTAE